jgi:RNA polymerase sigma-70 factor (ECF subfamily)
VEPAALDAVLKRARRRDPQALTALVDAYTPRVFGLLFRLSGSRDAAEDLVQETFLRVVRTIGEYEEAGKFEAWLFRIAANLARDLSRRGKRRGVTVALEGGSRDGEPGAIDVADAGRDEPPGRLMQVEAGTRLNACLDRLPQVDREIILLRHFSELSFKEIAAMLNIPLGTALARAHRALGKLREELTDESK